MIREKSLVIYRNRPAVVAPDSAGEKGSGRINIILNGSEKLRVREKDIEELYPGPCSLSDLDGEEPQGNVREAWELLEGSTVTVREIAELVYGAYTAKNAWAAYGLLLDGLYFTGNPGAVLAKPGEAVEAEEKKRNEKQKESLERENFLKFLKDRCSGKSGGNDEALENTLYRSFIQDVEALAWGKTDKSRTIRDLGIEETPQEAHSLLLVSGYWSHRVNPYPSRFGLSSVSARLAIDPPPAGEERADIGGLKALAIDNPWSKDPDDAVSVEAGPDGGHTLWVHVADPASSILPGSPQDMEARDRGSTLYLPEGAVRMICPDALSIYALGLEAVSPALSFKIILKADGSIAETGIVRSLVKVTRMSYAEADIALAEGSPELLLLDGIARRNINRRLEAGAVALDFPETHITVSGDDITVEALQSYQSAEIVRECMLLAGEGSAHWALQKRLAFPYVTQETGDLPGKPLPGLAGFYQIRRCLRPRSLSVRPSSHAGLGLPLYSQVTSPLRRYTDLLAHQQIRAFLLGGVPLSGEELLPRLAAGEAASQAAVHAERASKSHWLMVYLSGKKGQSWEGVLVDKKGNRGTFIIPELGIETQAALAGEAELNDRVKLTLARVNIPLLEPVFTVC